MQGTECDTRERWSVADEALAAKRRGRHGLAEFAHEHGIARSTARRWAWVAEAYPPSQRVMANLTYSHFEAVARMPNRVEMLRRASAERWSVSRLKTDAALSAGADSGSQDRLAMRSFGPKTIAEAEAYITKLAEVEAAGRARMSPTVRTAVERLAAASGTLAETWDT
jgi:hypothetical protein